MWGKRWAATQAWRHARLLPFFCPPFFATFDFQNPAG
jgi:hypothetical protein